MSCIDELQLESDQEEEGVTDFTNQRYDNTVRISNGFNIEQLTEGFIFNPEEVDPVKDSESGGYYSTRDPDDLVHLLEGRVLLEEEDAEDQESGIFEMMKKNGMEDITEAGDGGVLKRTVKAGIQSLPAVPERAVVKIHYSLYLEHQDEPFDSTLLRGKPEKHKIGYGGLLLVRFYISYGRSVFESSCARKIRIAKMISPKDYPYLILLTHEYKLLNFTLCLLLRVSSWASAP